MTETLSDKYLGLPALVGANRSDCFRHLIDRVNTRINGWKEKFLSMGGKEILIKSIAQAVPVYVKMMFKILKNSCKGITHAILQFWWGDEDDHKRIHWQEWWKLCVPKGKEGMGFRGLQSFNLAMLAKGLFGFNLLKFNSHHINVHSNAWSTKYRLIACMSAQMRSNLRDEYIKPN
jgi:hypothetical protein